MIYDKHCTWFRSSNTLKKLLMKNARYKIKLHWFTESNSIGCMKNIQIYRNLIVGKQVAPKLIKHCERKQIQHDLCDKLMLGTYHFSRSATDGYDPSYWTWRFDPILLIVLTRIRKDSAQNALREEQRVQATRRVPAHPGSIDGAPVINWWGACLSLHLIWLWSMRDSWHMRLKHSWYLVVPWSLSEVCNCASVLVSLHLY